MADLGSLHLTHGVDGLQAPKAGRVLRSKDQLGQMFSCMETQMDSSSTEEMGRTKTAECPTIQASRFFLRFSQQVPACSTRVCYGCNQQSARFSHLESHRETFLEMNL